MNEAIQLLESVKNRTIVVALLTMLGLFMMGSIISILFIERKKPQEAMIWILLVLVFPPIGVFLYLVLGSTLTIKRTYSRRNKTFKTQIERTIQTALESVKSAHRELDELEDEVYSEVITFNENYAKAFLTRRNEVEIFTNGHDMFVNLFADIEKAQKTIHVVFYSIHMDELGMAFNDVLTDAAKRGVDVKVMYDTLGSFGTTKRRFKQLRDAGGYTVGIKPLMTHFRNHRKIVVIDGEIGYTGGMNVGMQYLGMFKPKSPWRDTHIRMRGDGVAGLQYYFFYDWFYANKPKDTHLSLDDIQGSFPKHNIQSILPCQVLGSGVDTNEEYINRSYLRMISSARKSIRLQSPYFVPNETMLNAFQVAASTGVEVELMLPQRPASFFLEPTAGYYLDLVIDYGVKVFFYDGYIHAKTLAIDDKVICIGSINMDVRSLELNDEICTIFLDKNFGKRHRAIFEEDRKRCYEMDYEEFRNRSMYCKGKERFFALFAPLM